MSLEQDFEDHQFSINSKKSNQGRISNSDEKDRNSEQYKNDIQSELSYQICRQKTQINQTSCPSLYKPDRVNDLFTEEKFQKEIKIDHMSKYIINGSKQSLQSDSNQSRQIDSIQSRLRDSKQSRQRDSKQQRQSDSKQSTQSQSSELFNINQLENSKSQEVINLTNYLKQKVIKAKNLKKAINFDNLSDYTDDPLKKNNQTKNSLIRKKMILDETSQSTESYDSKLKQSKLYYFVQDSAKIIKKQIHQKHQKQDQLFQIMKDNNVFRLSIKKKNVLNHSLSSDQNSIDINQNKENICSQ